MTRLTLQRAEKMVGGPKIWALIPLSNGYSKIYRGEVRRGDSGWVGLRGFGIAGSSKYRDFELTEAESQLLLLLNPELRTKDRNWIE